MEKAKRCWKVFLTFLRIGAFTFGGGYAMIPLIQRETVEKYKWISDDDMKTWGEKIRLTDFPGEYSYTDGFYEDGHLRFVIEHNRHTVLYFDVTL